MQTNKKRGLAKWHHTRVTPSSTSSYREFLQRLYDDQKSRNPNYTYTSLSVDLGFSATGFVHQIIRGRRKLTSEGAKRIAKSVGLVGDERKYLLALISLERAKSTEDRLGAFETLAIIKSRLDSDALVGKKLEYFSMWYHPVVRELISLPKLNQNPEQIAKHIFPKVTSKQVEESINLLLRLDLIAKDPNTERYKPTANTIQTPDEVKNFIVTKYHASVIELAKSALLKGAQDTRTVNAITMRASQERVPEIKKLLNDFLKRLIATEEPLESTTTVLQLNVQLFPVATGIGASEEEDILGEAS